MVFIYLADQLQILKIYGEFLIYSQLKVSQPRILV